MPPIRILLAEDNADHQQLLLRALAKSGAAPEVVLAASGDRLLELARTESFDCVVIDYNLPPYTAPELIELLEGAAPEAPRVVISASEDQRIVIASMRTGVADFVRKDEAITGTNLWDRVERAIEVARAAQQDRRETNRRLVSLQKQAETDALTGLGNRAYLDRVLAPDPQELDRRRKDRRRATGIVMLDVDHFKRVNDTWGHAAGDDVLREIARLVRQAVSPSDTAIRWGGEEFVVLRQSATIAETWGWADDLRLAIGLAVGVGSPAKPVTVSMGVDVVPTAELCHDSIARADQALYLAKQSGRDRVCTWGMVCAMDAARASCTEPLSATVSARERLLEVVDRLTPTLGPVQRDHVGDHGLRVRSVASGVADFLGMDREAIEDLELAAEFHDIGKVGVPEEVLAAPRKLTAGERRLVAEHARFGADLLRACGASEAAAEAVATHHDRFRFLQRSTPTPGSVICACDALVTMMSSRPYAPKRRPDQAIIELIERRGSQFHPAVVDTITASEYHYLAA